MTTQNIIGYYKQWLLVEKDGFYYIVRRKERILFKGTEALATKAFGLLIADAITEENVIQMNMNWEET